MSLKETLKAVSKNLAFIKNEMEEMRKWRDHGKIERTSKKSEFVRRGHGRFGS